MLLLLQYLETAIIIFLIGFVGMCFCYITNTLIIFIMTTETMLLGSCLCFVLGSVCLYDFKGQIYSLFILSIAACETAIGLALMVHAKYMYGNLEFKSFSKLRG